MADVCEFLQDNKWMMALMVIISNIGSSYLKNDVEIHEAKYHLNCFWFRKLVMFALIYCATSDVKISLYGTLLYVLILYVF